MEREVDMLAVSALAEDLREVVLEYQVWSALEKVYNYRVTKTGYGDRRHNNGQCMIRTVD